MLFHCLASALIFFLSFHAQIGQGAGKLTPFKRTDEFIADDGYIAEEFKVTTADGYVLTIFRIPYGLDGPSIEYRPAILLIPGIGSTSDQWLMVEENSLAYLLANEGYDVWLGNYRGSSYGKENLYYSIKSEKFWDFSYHESGVYDLPATIDFVLKQTGQSDLIYLGFSKGTTTFFVLTSLFPEYNKKISLGIIYAPVLEVKGSTSLAINLSISIYKTEKTEKFFRGRRIYHVSLLDDSSKFARFLLCNEYSVLKSICWANINFLCGYDPTTERNVTHSGKFFSHIPNTVALGDLYQLIQTGQSGRFAQYDYGSKNMEIYGRLTPPRYPIENVKVPLLVAHADKDIVSSKKMLKNLIKRLRTPYKTFHIPYKNFTHADYVLTTEPELLYIPTIKYIKEFSSTL